MVFAFPYKITWPTRCIAALYSLPRGHRVQALSLVLGCRRVQLPGGAAFDSRSCRSRDYELRASTTRESVRCATSLHVHAHVITSAHVHAHTPCHSHTDCDLRVPAWRPGRVQQGPFSRAPFWRGLFFPEQSAHTALSARGVPINVVCACAEVYLHRIPHEMGNLGTHHMGMESAKSS